MYLEYSFSISPLQPAAEILAAELSMVGFESFLDTPNGIRAYIQQQHWNSAILKTIRILGQPEFSISYTFREIPRVNWNAEWEKNFNAVHIDDLCTVRAPFHPEPDTAFDIVISPKMSFGTGHHETTRMMLQLLLKEDLNGKNILDMGCGTGVLAILAEKKGALHIDAVDIDHWCYLNTLENAAVNHCKNISVYQGNVSQIAGKTYDIIIANINRNVLLHDIPAYAACLNSNGIMLLSGFYREDGEMIRNTCEEFSLKLAENMEMQQWIAVKYVN